MLNGDPDRIDPDVPMEYQTIFLPYDKKWEFPRKRLRLGLLFFNISLMTYTKTKVRLNQKEKKSDPVISDELSKPRPWVSKTPMKM